MKSKTYRNLSGSGTTTYHEDGTKSKTYENLTNDGFTTYHEDGSKTVSFPNVTDSGFTSYHTPAAAEFDFLYAIFGVILIALSVLSLFELGIGAILSIALMALSIAARIILNRKHQTTLFVFWAHPFTLLGWRLLVNSMWAGTNGNILELFGIFVLTLGIVATLFLDCGDSFGMFFYAAASLLVMLVAKAFGDLVPYFLVLALLAVAFLVTVIRLSVKKRRNGK